MWEIWYGIMVAKSYYILVGLTRAPGNDDEEDQARGPQEKISDDNEPYVEDKNSFGDHDVFIVSRLYKFSYEYNVKLHTRSYLHGSTYSK
jgi:hypothetical protein